MAKNQARTKCNGPCEKIYKAIRQISKCPQSSKSTRPAPNSLPPSPDQKKSTNEVISIEVPINFNTPIDQKNGQVGKVGSIAEQPNNELVITRVGVLEKGKEAKAASRRGRGEENGNENEKFFNYIHQAKAKLRTTSDVGGRGGVGGGRRLDSFNDKVNNYLIQAKNKIRTTSKVGRRSLSNK